MSIDPAFDTPFDNYGQVGSFVAPVAVPSSGPLDGTLVNLPCINPAWLRLVLGCVDQLRNRSSWLPTYTDAQMVTILGQVEDLRVALQMAQPCCNVQMRLQANCILQFSTDGGATWSDVTGWAANFDECVRQGLIPTPPLLPPGTPVTQRACNIAGYIANDIVKEAIAQAINAYNHNLSLLALAGNIAAATFAFELPWTAAFIYAVYDLYAYFTAGNIADLTSAEADPILWSDVTCAIFNAIKADGAVTRTNFGSVLSAVCGLSYTPSIAVTVICTFLTDLGVDGLLALQAEGALNVADCSGCSPGAWCYVFTGATIDFPAWHPDVNEGDSSVVASFSGGVAYSLTFGGTTEELHLYFPFASATTLTSVEVVYNTPGAANGASRGGSYASGHGWPLSTTSGNHDDTFTGFVTAAHWLEVVMDSQANPGGHNSISKIIVRGTGTCPFGAPNC